MSPSPPTTPPPPQRARLRRPCLRARRDSCLPHAGHDATPGPGGAAGDAAHAACARRAHGRPAASRYVVPARVALRGAGQDVVFEGTKRTRRRVRAEAARRRGVWWGWGGVRLGVCWGCVGVMLRGGLWSLVDGKKGFGVDLRLLVDPSLAGQKAS